jgi:MFS transporter, SHS family, lactate transporter
MLAADFFGQARGLTRDQRNAFIASFLGWTMDSFDFCLILVVLAQIAEDFHTSLGAVTVATTLTLAARPVGAPLIGLLADKYGRRVPLMIDVLFYSVIELCSAR